MPATIRKKIIEHSLPLDAINAASSREKSVRHGHPSTLHLWWARRPLAACRAVIFAQLVDDPSAWPEKFETEEDQDRERRRLHGVIENMVEWPKSDAKDQARFKSAIEAARWEIARSVAWGRGEEAPARSDAKAVLAYLQEYAPPVYDPFCGGGSIPLEAQRLGLRAYGSDLNPIPVLITKALIEFPPKFAGLPPVHPVEPGKASLLTEQWSGARGLAEDVRYYGQWMRDEAEKKIGHLYPKATLPDGSERPVIAWLWARTVASPDPAQKGAHVPLVSSFVLSSKKGKEAIVVPVIDPAAPDGWRFEVKTEGVTKQELAEAKEGTKSKNGRGFVCLLSGAAIGTDHVRAEGVAGRLSERLMATIADAPEGRRSISPNAAHERAADILRPEVPDLDYELPKNPRDTRLYTYGIDTFAKIFTPRQLQALVTFSDLIAEVREKVWKAALDKISDAPSERNERLFEGGRGAAAYADAVATYLSLSTSKMSMFLTTQSRWRAGETKTAPAFGRQALAMVWDYAETNPFAGAGGDFATVVSGGVGFLSGLAIGSGSVMLNDAASNMISENIAVNTDPPYYDNIGYADLSDYFYGWLRRACRSLHPDLFRRRTTPKSEELVALAYRHGGNEAAEQHFMRGMKEAMTNMRGASIDDTPLAIYYAFKQSEQRLDGVVSPGWATFLQAIVDAALLVDGTWPIRTEMATRQIAGGTNALASSVVLVCRPRPSTAGAINRRDFLRELRPAMQQAILDHQKAGVPLPDRRQAAIGPGIGVFSKYAMVRESDDSPMSVATALALINREIDAILAEGTEDLDAETRFALEWYQQFGYGQQRGKAGDAIQQLQGFNLDINSINASGLFRAEHGDAKLLSRGEMEDGWTPSKDATFTLWEMAQHLARALTAEDGGLAKCGQLLAEKPTAAADVLLIAERMFEMATTRGENDEALVWNQLQTSWPGIETAADEANERGYSPAPEQTNLI
jgi:putative DNA methylase